MACFRSRGQFGLELAVILLNQAMHLTWHGALLDGPMRDTSVSENWPDLTKDYYCPGVLLSKDERDELYLLKEVRNRIVHDVVMPDLRVEVIGRWIWLAIAVCDQKNIGFRASDFQNAPEFLPATRFSQIEHHLAAIRLVLEGHLRIDPGQSAHVNAGSGDKRGYVNNDDDEEEIYADIALISPDERQLPVDVATAATITLDRGRAWATKDLAWVYVPLGYLGGARRIAEEAGYDPESVAPYWALRW
jgi:hypothetical protein